MARTSRRIAVSSFVLCILLLATGCGERSHQQAASSGGGTTSGVPAVAAGAGTEAAATAPADQADSAGKKRYTLKITLHGLVAFVPVKAHDKQQVWAVLPRADDPKRRRIPPGADTYNGTISLHHPFLVVPLKHLQGSDQYPYHETPVYLSLTSKDALHPKSDLKDYFAHDIGFKTRFEGDKVGCLQLSDVPDLSDPDIKEDPHQRICKDCLKQPPPAELADYVAARFLIETGTVKSGEPLGLPIIFGYYNSRQYVKKPKSYPDLPQSVTVTMTYLAKHGEPLILVLTNFPVDAHGTRPEQQFNLWPAGGSEIDLDIVNLPGEEVLKRMEVNRVDDVSDHFALYYLVSLSKEPPFLMPYLNEHGGQPYCGVVQFKP
jgi:hypothetical protein